MTILKTAVAACIAITSIAAQVAVSPADRSTFEGDSSSSYPLGRHDGRFQQIHADLGQAARSITQHSYRRDAIALRGDVPAFTAELEVTLSVAAVAPTAANRDFAANIGPNPVTVLSRTRLSFPTTSRPASDPAPSFELRIPYGIPFQLPASAPLCVDITMFGNVTSRGPNLNFTAYLDAHQMPTNGTVSQPGYSFDVGCAAPGASSIHTGTFSFDRATDGSLSLDIRSRHGVPSVSGAPALTALIVGFSQSPMVWPWRPECRLIPALDATFTLPGDNDASGSWDGALAGIPPIAPGQRFLVQLASAAPSTGDLTFSNAAVVTVPTTPPAILPAVRISSASDRTSPTGAVARTVTVTEFR